MKQLKIYKSFIRRFGKVSINNLYRFCYEVPADEMWALFVQFQERYIWKGFIWT